MRRREAMRHLAAAAAAALGTGCEARRAETPPLRDDPMSIGIVWHETYQVHRAPGHPERPERLAAIREAFEEAGLWDDLRRIEPRPASRETLQRVHTDALLETLAGAAVEGRVVWLEPDTYVGDRSREVALLAAGGACAAVDAVMAGTVSAAFCAVRPPGHHATPGRAMGFCLLNNVAVAAGHARAAHGLERVAIVDFDVHHGNGTQEAFYRDGAVFYLSTHQWPLYPGTGRAEETGDGPGRGTIRNFPLSRADGDDEVLAALEEGLEQVEAFGPDLMLVSAGFDAHRDDPLAGLAMTEEGFAEATRRIRAVADRTCGGRVVSCLEGGYALEALGRSAAAHVAALGEAPAGAA